MNFQTFKLDLEKAEASDQIANICWIISSSNAWKWKVKVKSLSCVWLLATPWTAAFQGFSIHGIFQARVMEWGAIAFSDLAP